MSASMSRHRAPRNASFPDRTPCILILSPREPKTWVASHHGVIALHKVHSAERRFRTQDDQLSVGQRHVQIVQLGIVATPQSVSNGTVIYALRLRK